ncbi:uncharacterized protein LOC112024073 isoform X2 [Quercus suber]|uniref:uncharacterized protein LOC112024073 isoform X2 n=1 Tax=Quercus suber TaxID=58331 RepID=UPI0032DF6CFF
MEILTHLGFEEYINLILDNAGKVNIKRQSKKPLVPLPSFTRTTILHMAGTYGFFSHSHGGLLSESHLGVLIRTSTLWKGATMDFAGIVLNMSWKKEADLLNDITTSNQILYNTQSQQEGQHSAYVYHMPEFMYKE